jgi:hypothetical protein
MLVIESLKIIENEHYKKGGEDCNLYTFRPFHISDVVSLQDI